MRTVALLTVLLVLSAEAHAAEPGDETIPEELQRRINIAMDRAVKRIASSQRPDGLWDLPAGSMPSFHLGASALAGLASLS